MFLAAVTHWGRIRRHMRYNYYKSSVPTLWILSSYCRSWSMIFADSIYESMFLTIVGDRECRVNAYKYETEDLGCACARTVDERSQNVLKGVEMFRCVPTTVWRCNAVRCSDSSLPCDYIHVSKDVVEVLFFPFMRDPYQSIILWKISQSLYSLLSSLKM